MSALCKCDRQESSLKKANVTAAFIKKKCYSFTAWQHFLYNSIVFFPINLSTPLKIIYPCSKMFDAFMDPWICGEMVFWSRFGCQLLLCAESSVAHKYDLCLIQKPGSNLPLMGHCEPNESSFTHTTCWTVSWHSGLVDWWTYGHYKGNLCIIIQAILQ